MKNNSFIKHYMSKHGIYPATVTKEGTIMTTPDWALYYKFLYRELSLKEVRELPVLSTAQTSDLLWESENIRIWYNRTGADSGEAYDNMIVFEQYYHGEWNDKEYIYPLLKIPKPIVMSNGEIAFLYYDEIVCDSCALKYWGEEGLSSIYILDDVSFIESCQDCGIVLDEQVPNNDVWENDVKDIIVVWAKRQQDILKKWYNQSNYKAYETDLHERVSKVEFVYEEGLVPDDEILFVETFIRQASKLIGEERE